MKSTLSFLSTAIKKSSYIALFLPMITLALPEIVIASSLQSEKPDRLVFEISPNKNEIQDVIAKYKTSKSLTIEEIQAHDIDYQKKRALENLLRDYLAKRGSPLASCSEILVQQENMDKILSLAAAESGLAKRYIRSTNNIWGWNGGRSDMGATLCDAVVQMNTNLENYPRRSAVKYADMSYVDMCGLYKQPCREKGNHHWVRNNQTIVNNMNELRGQAEQIALASIGKPIQTATNSIEVAVK